MAREGTLDPRYVAAFFDAEGSVVINNPYRPQVYIGNTYLPVLELLQNTHGGSIHLRKKYTSSLSQKPFYVWQLRKMDEVRIFLEIIVSHTIIKRADIVAALTLLQEPKHAGKKSL